MFNPSIKLTRYRCKALLADSRPPSEVSASLRQAQAWHDPEDGAQRELLDGMPDERQPDQFSCGAAAAFSVGEYFGVGPKNIKGWERALGTNLKYSTHPHAIYNYLRSPEQPELPIPDEYPQHDFNDPCGLRVEAKDGMTIDDLRRATRAGCPVIVPVQDYGHRRETGAAFQYGHYLIVVRVSMGRVTCQDSTTDNLIEGQESIQEPGRIPIREEDFLDAWHDQDAEGNKFVQFGIVVGPPIKASKAWRESEHPRGQPENAGQFGPGGGGKKKPRSDRKPEAESAKLQASTAQAGPMHGHPLAGASAEEVMRLVNPKNPSAAAATWDNPNPLHYNQATFPKAVDGGKFTESILAAIKKQESRNAFQRLTLPQAYEAVKKTQPGLNYWDFQNGLAKLQADRTIRLGPYTQAIGTHEKPEMLMPLDREYKWYVSR